MRVLSLSFWVILVGLLAGCSGGAVVFVPTPLPPDVSPTTYTHPSGVFSIVLPRNWSVYEQSTNVIASVSFAPPNSSVPLVQIGVVNLGEDIEADELGSLMFQYQTQIRPDLVNYTEQDRQALPDGSWRVAGIRNIENKPQPLNTFFQRAGSFFSVMEVVIPQDPALASDTQTFINTFNINGSAEFPIETLAALSTVSTAQLEIQHVSTWTTPSGVFYISGEVVNHSTEALGNVPVRAQLLDANNNILLEAQDLVMGHSILPNGYAPFSLRFGQGQPPTAVNFSLLLGGNTAPQAIQAISAPDLEWTDTQQQGTDGQLYITGEVTNSGEVTVRQGIATVTVFDTQGNVIGAGFANFQDENLEPNRSTTFVILVSDLGGEALNYIVNAQGLP
jgi:hypothetical protein